MQPTIVAKFLRVAGDVLNLVFIHNFYFTLTILFYIDNSFFIYDFFFLGRSHKSLHIGSGGGEVGQVF